MLIILILLSFIVIKFNNFSLNFIKLFRWFILFNSFTFTLLLPQYNIRTIHIILIISFLRNLLYLYLYLFLILILIVLLCNFVVFISLLI